jgi:hypothetical protein
MKPAGEDLYRDRLRLWRTDRVKVLALKLGDGFSEGALDDVEVADHPSPVEGLALDDDLDPVIVFVEIALGRWEPGNTVQCPQACRRADFEPAGHE